MTSRRLFVGFALADMLLWGCLVAFFLAGFGFVRSDRRNGNRSKSDFVSTSQDLSASQLACRRVVASAMPEATEVKPLSLGGVASWSGTHPDWFLGTVRSVERAAGILRPTLLALGTRLQI